MSACSPANISPSVNSPSLTPSTTPLPFLPSATYIPTQKLTADPTSIGLYKSTWPTQTPLPALEPAQYFTLTHIQMADENIGWVIDATGHRLRTMDGGYTWKDVTAPEIGFFSSAGDTHAWEIVRTRVPCDQIGCTVDWVPSLVTWRTLDGGQTWQRGAFIDSGAPDFRPISMQFIDEKKGWFLLIDQVGMSGFTYESLFQTLDGGDSWKLIQPVSNGCISGGMIFTSTQNGWIGYDCSGLSNTMTGTRLEDFLKGVEAPVLSRTLDGGTTWTDAILPAPQVFPANLMSTVVDPNASVYCGIKEMDLIAENSFILQWSCNTNISPPLTVASYAYLTEDDGQTWRSWLSTGSEFFITPDTGWRIFASNDQQPTFLQQTTDGGETWNTIKPTGWQAAQFDFVNEQVGWALVTDQLTSAFVHTLDGGRTWEVIRPVITQ
jgi:photosystem II stability/assembly factor-like uncharacterized protein